MAPCQRPSTPFQRPSERSRFTAIQRSAPMAFVAAGFEHSIANMYFFPLAMLLGAPLSALDLLRNLVPVIAGNLAGGSVLVALFYWTIYLRPQRP
jgi:formate/nitrite transporter FocA (FNT family)